MSGDVRRFVWPALVLVALLAGCGSTSLNRAPVEDRNSSSLKSTPGTTDPRAAAAKPLPVDNAAKSGYYTVRPKDTLIGIGLETGQSHKDIARWNGIENANKIEIGQVLRVAPPVEPGAAVSRPVASVSLVPSTIGVAGAAGVASSAAGAAASAAAAAKPGMLPASAPVAATDDELAWVWPGNGTVLMGFDEVKNKGLDLGGAAGDAVLAAADGRVVYAGAGLRGYGNLIILKHNATYLTAYAHNQTLLVKEEQSVKKGQKIAEMGNSDADRVKLHFEVRRQGKPVDPLKYLPTR
jgi:lipoprotein NlpD